VVYMKKNYPIIGTKSSLLWDEKTDAWVYISGEPERPENPKSYFKIVPTLYRAVDRRAKSIATLPWALMKGETEYETSDAYENKDGLVSNMFNMLYLIEASMTLTGQAYWKREQNVAGYDKLRHLIPTSLNLNEERATRGELVWTRYDPVLKRDREYTPKEIIYFWYLDPYVEIGPPSSWPVQAAMAACGVLANIDEFARNFFMRGAIKAMLFAMEGISPQEGQKFESWWKRFVGGINNAFTTKVLNAAKVTPVVVGEGIKELENVSITQDKREEVAVALDIPFSLLFSNAANYATAERDKLNWYEDFVVPEAEFIAGILNEQVYEPLGLRLEFRPETLDIFQEDETQRATAMSAFMDALEKANTFEMAQALFLIYGVEVSDEAMSLIEKHYSQKEEMAAQIQAGVAEGQEQPEEEDDEPIPPAPKAAAGLPLAGLPMDIQQLSRELSIWQSKCLSALKRGEPAADVSFVPVLIPAEKHAAIAARLETATTAEEVKAAFRDGQNSAIEIRQDGTLLLAEQLKRANDLLERELEPAIASAGAPA